MSKLSKKPDGELHRHRTVHDLSHNFKFTAAVGHILPVEHDILLPNDTVNCRISLYGKNLLPFLSPVMADFDFHVDYFFVPMMLIHQNFASIIYGIKDNFSSAISQSAQGLPYVSAVSLHKEIANSFNRNLIFGNQMAINMEWFGKGALRLLEHFGIDNRVFMRPKDASLALSYGGYAPNFFPWQLAAYQCVYQYYFRDEDLEQFDNSSFNLDKYGYEQLPYSNSTSQLSATATYKLLQMRYHRCYGDYFQSVFRSPLINENNLLGNLSASYSLLRTYDDLGQATIRGTFNDEYQYSGGYYHNNPSTVREDAPLSVMEFSGVSSASSPNTGPDSIGIGSPSGANQFGRTTDQMRKLFAVEKLLTLTERNKKNYDSQTLAHFGIKVPHDVKHEISHIGHDKSTMRLSEITAMASGSTESASVNFGDYAGRGDITLKGHGCRFTAPCHGVFLAVLSIVPRYDYTVYNVKRNFVHNRLDFFQPEFDGLGMQPIFRYEVDKKMSGYGISQLSTENDELTAENFATDIQGWQYRYTQFKTGINRCTHAFELEPLNSWVLRREPVRNRPFGHLNNGGDVFSYYTNTVGSSTGDYQGFATYYVSPADTNGLFATNYQCWDTPPNGSFSTPEDNTWNFEPELIYENDPFFVFANIDYKKVSIMSTYSMPKLGSI